MSRCALAPGARLSFTQVSGYRYSHREPCSGSSGALRRLRRGRAFRGGILGILAANLAREPRGEQKRELLLRVMRFSDSTAKR